MKCLRLVGGGSEGRLADASLLEGDVDADGFVAGVAVGVESQEGVEIQVALELDA